MNTGVAWGIALGAVVGGSLYVFYVFRRGPRL